MVILLVLLLLIPPLISVALFEKFKGYRLSYAKRGIAYLVFAYFIHMGSYFTIWLRGHDYVVWSIGQDSSLTSVSFCFKYMAISLLFTAVMPFMLSIIRVGKRK